MNYTLSFQIILLGIFVAAVVRKTEDLTESEENRDVICGVDPGDNSRAATPTKSKREQTTVYNTQISTTEETCQELPASSKLDFSRPCFNSIISYLRFQAVRSYLYLNLLLLVSLSETSRIKQVE